MSILFNFVFAFVVLNTLLFSVSAPPFPYEVEQPDGSKIPVRMFGDEYYNWMETADGYVLGHALFALHAQGVSESAAGAVCHVAHQGHG